MSAEEKTAGAKPEFLAYNVKDLPEGKSQWNRVGAAWPHRDGEGYDVKLDSTPVDGRVTLRTLRDEREQELAQEAQERPRERTRQREARRER